MEREEFEEQQGGDGGETGGDDGQSGGDNGEQGGEQGGDETAGQA